MCGGRGTRLDADVEKPLFEVGGRPMVNRVRDALDASRTDTTYAVTSPHTPKSRRHLEGLPIIETPGDGYVADLDRALDRVARPVLTVAADLPLLDADAIDSVMAAHAAGSLAVCVPAGLKRCLDVSLDGTFDQRERELAPTGVNVVGERGESVHVTYDARFAVNVNRREDAAVAEALL